MIADPTLIAPLAVTRPRLMARREGKPRAHLIGVAGAGMQALAEVLLARGWDLSGSDTDVAPAAWMRERGVSLFAGHDQRCIDGRVSRVIYSDAVPAENIERRKAARLGLPLRSYAQTVGALMAERRGLSVAGTHGKSTTTAMIGEILCAAGLDPTVLCGAAPAAGGHGGRRGAGPWLVAEACEYRANFLHQQPAIAVVLGVEPDHFDFYATPADLTAAFEQFVRGAASDGATILNADCPVARQLRGAARSRVATFGFAADAEWRPAQVEHARGRHHFTIERHGDPICRVTLRVPGRHQVLNALAAAAATHAAGVSVDCIAEGLGRFAGLRRRLEHVACLRGIDLVDDYAHHPTEVRAALAALRQMFPRRRVWCVFEPHQVSRTEALLDEFAASLHNADRVAVTDVFAAREAAPYSPRQIAQELVRRARARGVEVLPDCDAEVIIEKIMISAQPGDVVVTLGAGEVWKRSHELVDRLRTNRQAG